MIRQAERLTSAVGALDEHLMGGGQPPADWRHAAAAGAGDEPLRVTAARIAAEHISWQVKITEPGSMTGCRRFALVGVRSWVRGRTPVVALVDGDDTRGGQHAGTERTYPAGTPCELLRPARKPCRKKS